MGMAGANFRILAKNLADTASSLGVAGGLSMSASLPITNLQKQTERSRTARTTGVGTWTIQVVLPAQQTVDVAALTRTNFSSAATVRVRTYSDAFFTALIYDTGTGPAIIQSGLDAIDVLSDTDFANLRNVVCWLPQASNVRSINIDLADAANPAGYLEATRLWAGNAFEASYDPAFGSVVEFSFADASVMGRAADGTMLVDKRYKNRSLKLGLDYVVDKDLPTMLAIARYLGKDKEFLFSLYPGWGGAKELYNQGAFRITDSPTFNPMQVGLHKNTMTFEET